MRIKSWLCGKVIGHNWAMGRFDKSDGVPQDWVGKFGQRCLLCGKKRGFTKAGGIGCGLGIVDLP